MKRSLRSQLFKVIYYSLSQQYFIDGEHQGCIMLPDGAFDVNSYHQVKTEILSFIEQRIEKQETP